VLVEPGLKEGEVQLFLLRFGRLVETRSLPVPPSPDDVAALRTAVAEHFDPDLEAPAVFGRAEVDEINILARWVRLNEASAHHVHWTPERSPDDMVAAILAAVA
jgi:hypothetical protein